MALKVMMAKWRAYGGRINSGLPRNLGDNDGDWLWSLERWKRGTGIGEEVPQTLFLLKNGEGTIWGAVALRHFLNSTNIVDGGHVGAGICPEFRGKGYGRLLLRLALQKLAGMGVKRVLVTCDADNFASQATILSNQGVFENRLSDEDGTLVNRYWIENDNRWKDQI